MHGQGREFYSYQGREFYLGACSDQGWEYLHAWSREGGVLLMLGASTGQGLFWGID